jgi:hypothetical protein
VAPVAGFKVRDPDAGFQHIPEAGETVRFSSYWRRMISEGAVTIVEDPTPTKPQE